MRARITIREAETRFAPGYVRAKDGSLASSTEDRKRKQIKYRKEERRREGDAVDEIAQRGWMDGYTEDKRTSRRLCGWMRLGADVCVHRLQQRVVSEWTSRLRGLRGRRMHGYSGARVVQAES